MLWKSVALLQAVVSSVNRYFQKLLQDKRYNLLNRYQLGLLGFPDGKMFLFCHWQFVLYLSNYFVYQRKTFHIKNYENQYNYAFETYNIVHRFWYHLSYKVI